tara:strand:+ start:28 stop:501 length:474 start_codon:yes stop_codon:yes gene_type:complete
MFNTKPNNTAELEGTLVQLDALYKSYETVLQSAQEQLEALSLSDADYDKLLNKAAQNQDLITRLSVATTNRVITALGKEESDKLTAYLTAEVTKRVAAALEEDLAERLNAVVKTIIDSETFERAVDAKMCENQTVKDCIDVTTTLKSLVKKVMPDQS